MNAEYTGEFHDNLMLMIQRRLQEFEHYQREQARKEKKKKDSSR
jgi:hypothetical protein